MEALPLCDGRSAKRNGESSSIVVVVSVVVGGGGRSD